MKINWGTGIVIAFVAFIGFILFFVVRMSTDHRVNHDLVTEDYYRAELAYQKEIDAETNARDAIDQLKITRTPEGLLVVLPKGINTKQLKGKVSLYRPSNRQLDFDLSLSQSDPHLLIPDKRLLDGRWDIKVSWEYQGKEFLYKERLTY